MAFEPGAQVHLKSGGPKMTVVDFGKYDYGTAEKYKCRWFDDKGKLTEDTFTEAELKGADDSSSASRAVPGGGSTSWMAN